MLEMVTVDYAFVVREASGETRALYDRHVFGVFSEKVWTDTLTAAGFEAQAKPFKPDVDHETAPALLLRNVLRAH